MLTKKALIIALAIIGLVSFKMTHSVEPGTKERAKQNIVPIIIYPVDNVKFSSPITAFIDSIPFRAGMTFKKGDVLVEYNCTVLRSEKEKAESAAQYLKDTAHNVERLFRLGGTSRNEMVESRSREKEAQEELKIKTYMVSQCLIKAPFDGQVSDIFASAHEYIEQGKPLIEVVDLKKLEIKLILSSEWLGWIKEGTEFKIKLNETSQSYPAKISRITYSIDPVSNTFTAFATFVQTNDEVKPGMSGYADFGIKK